MSGVGGEGTVCVVDMTVERTVVGVTSADVADDGDTVGWTVSKAGFGNVL